jgi:membrane-bound serine protease (ClpP class)
MFVLMLIAMYGIIGELSNPGAILPGVAGAIALVLLLYMSAVLPMNLAGIALVVLALALFVADIFAPTHGILTAGGVVAFFLGSLMLFDQTPFRLSLAMIIPATVVTALFFVFVVGAGLRAQKLPVKVGSEAMLGRTTTTMTPVDAHGGRVFVEGEYWTAVSDVPIGANETVEIVGFQGLTLKVKPKTA